MAATTDPVQVLAGIAASTHDDGFGRTVLARQVNIADRVHAEALVAAIRANTPAGAALRAALLGPTTQQWGCAEADQPEGNLHPYDQWNLRETAEHQIRRLHAHGATSVVLVVRDVGPWREAGTDD